MQEVVAEEERMVVEEEVVRRGRIWSGAGRIGTGRLGVVGLQIKDRGDNVNAPLDQTKSAQLIILLLMKAPNAFSISLVKPIGFPRLMLNPTRGTL